MIKKLIKKLGKNILKLIIKILYLTFRKKFLFLTYSILNERYEDIIINKKIIKFFSPNEVISWRIKTFFYKEPETLEFINKFNKKKITFWDIGSNIGLYAIYAATIHKNIEVISFEPSINNIRVLARNISVNNLQDKIKIITQPLSEKKNKFALMNEVSKIEGEALNSFDKKMNHEGKKINSIMNYSILGTNIDYLIENKILDIPDYIKIDVDGLEHIILKGAKKLLKNKKLRKISIELNENFKEQYQTVNKIMKKNGFKLLYNSKVNPILYPDKNKIVKNKIKKLEQTYNFHFSR
tara:strand:+ start:1584 stop:2471 length:888 start_codon:yes stop_codon:yes gene_type:complete